MKKSRLSLEEIVQWDKAKELWNRGYNDAEIWIELKCSFDIIEAVGVKHGFMRYKDTSEYLRKQRVLKDKKRVKQKAKQKAKIDKARVKIPKPFNTVFSDKQVEYWIGLQGLSLDELITHMRMSAMVCLEEENVGGYGDLMAKATQLLKVKHDVEDKDPQDVLETFNVELVVRQKVD